MVELSPLERARALVVWSCESGDDADRRKALANLSTELSNEGVDDVAVAAQGLAWSQPAPAPAAALVLARGTEADGHPG